jgi:hypothetical protein
VDGGARLGYKGPVRRRNILGLGFTAAAVWLCAACQPASNICGERTEVMLQLDGGAQRCVRSEDCPRPANVLICVAEGQPERECVSCTDTQCLRHVPELCR